MEFGVKFFELHRVVRNVSAEKPKLIINLFSVDAYKQLGAFYKKPFYYLSFLNAWLCH